jgi:hypothetical protein
MTGSGRWLMRMPAGFLCLECALRLAPVCLLGLLLYRVLGQGFKAVLSGLPIP